MDAAQSTITFGTSGPGTILGKYRLIAKLGVGGMGIVFSAEHQRLGRRVAVKLLKPEYGGKTTQAKRFEAEARLVSRLGHPNIVEVYDFGELPDGSMYYVMELMEGRTLRSRIAEGPLSEDEMMAVFVPLISAVQMAHSVGVVHRDLKPDNVMLLPGGSPTSPRVKLMDFGIAKIRDDNNVSMGTESGAILGTPAYMAPEQVRNSARVDHRADIYAIGVLLYESLCGMRPFRGSLPELLAAQLFDTPQPPSQIAAQKELKRPQINWAKMDAVVLRALDKEADKRYADCGALLADLRNGFTDLRISGHIPTIDQVPATVLSDRALLATLNRRSRILRYAASAAGVLALLGIGGALTLRSQGQRPTENNSGAMPTANATQPNSITDKARSRLQTAEHGSPVDRRGLLLAIAAVRSSQQRAFILQAMSDAQLPVWRAAVQAALALPQRKDPEMAEALRGLLSRATGPSSVEVAMARLRVGDDAAVDTLRTAVSSPTVDPETRVRAATTLSETHKLPLEALRAVITKAAQGGGLRQAVYRTAIAELLRQGDNETRRRIDKDLNSSKAPLRREAVEVAARTGYQSGRDELLTLANNAPPPERIEMLALLAELGDPRAAEPLKTFLQDASPIVRQRATLALGALGNQPPEIFAPLVGDREPLVAIAAAVALLDTVDTDKPRRP